jgi:hypothetical protein
MWGGAKNQQFTRIAREHFGHAPLIGVQSSYVAQLDVQLLPQLKMDSKRDRFWSQLKTGINCILM